MGRTSGAIGHGGRAIILALVVAASTVRADVTTERSSSILVFPKVISNAPAIDTIIQISNTSNSMVFAHCLYVNGAPRDPNLTAQLRQPAAMPGSRFRHLPHEATADALGGVHRAADRQHGYQRSSRADGTFRDCNGAGLDPGTIPPVSDSFTGELKCIEVDSSGAPINGNHLKGEATIVSADGDASKYNAIGVHGIEHQLQRQQQRRYPVPGWRRDSELPQRRRIQRLPRYGDRQSFRRRCQRSGDRRVRRRRLQVVRTEVTLVPCTEDFENQIPGQAVVQFVIINEFEELFSTSTTLTCWANWDLGAVNSVFNEALPRLPLRANPDASGHA